MMIAGELEPCRKRGWKWVLGSLLGGGAVGYAGGFLLADHLDALVGGKPDASLMAAMLVALVYALSAIIVLAGLINPRLGQMWLNVEDAEELIEQRSLLLASGLVMLGVAAVLTLVALAGPAGPLPAAPVGLACAALFAAVVAASIRQYRLSDELMRELSREAGSWAFQLLAVFGCGWGAAAHLGFVEGPQALDWVTAAAAAMLIGTFVAVGKRGLLAPRR